MSGNAWITLACLAASIGILKGFHDSRQMRDATPNHRWNKASDLYRDWWVR